jgi:hypothetical protein
MSHFTAFFGALFLLSDSVGRGSLPNSSQDHKEGCGGGALAIWITP